MGGAAVAEAADGTRLAYRPEGSGDPVGLVHGLSGSHDLWENQVPALAGRFQVITIDARGHGESDHPSEPWDVPTLAGDLVALLDHLGIGRAQLEHAVAVLVGKPPAELTIPPSPLDVSAPAIPAMLPAELL